MYDKQFMLIFTFTANLESPCTVHVFGLWEEAGVPEGNPWGEHANSTQRGSGQPEVLNSEASESESESEKL